MIKDEIIEQASKDILTAKYLFKNKTAQDLKKYNHNYHCNVHYKLNTGLRRYYMRYLLKERCKRTFLYESNVYKNANKYVPLNLETNDEDKQIYKDFFSFLKYNSIIDGEVLKLFSSCCNNHCEEIIKDLDNIKKDVEDLDDAPILYIVKKIIDISDDVILLENEILINWEKSIFSYNYDSNKNIYMGLYIDNRNSELEKILNRFIEEYNPVITRREEDFLVRFTDEKLYNNFKNYALELSKPYYIFEGDVLDLVRVEKEYEGIIELKLWNSFDVTNVLAKILGIRKDY